MNRTDMISGMAVRTGIAKKDCAAALNAVIQLVEETLKTGNKVQIAGFGSFEVKERAARTGRNPRTKEEIEIPAAKMPVFKAGKTLKEAVQ